MNLIEKRKAFEAHFYVPSFAKPSETEMDAVNTARKTLAAAGLFVIADDDGRVLIRRENETIAIGLTL